MLDRNTHNRPLSNADILRWATEMEAGRWKLNGEAIKIAEDMAILDGQHRLHALALQENGLTIRTLVVRGLPNDTQKTMDQGRKRSPADQLHLAGVAASNSVASAIRFYLVVENGWLFKDNKRWSAELTVPALVDWSVANGEIVELMRRAEPFRAIKARPGVMAAAYAMFAQVHGVEPVDEFYGRTLDGVGLPADSPILALRNRLDAVNGTLTRRQKQRITDRDLLATVIVAFNAWVRGKGMSRINRPPGAAWTADNFPEIVGRKEGV